MNDSIPIEVYWSTPENVTAGWCVQYAIELFEEIDWKTEYSRGMSLAYGKALAQASADPEVIELTLKYKKHMFEVVHKHGGKRWKCIVEQDE